MKVVGEQIKDLHLDPSNVRSHDQRNVDAVKASLQRFGQQKPIVCNTKGVVVAGNATVQAAKELGWEALKVTHTSLEGAEAIAYAIADNRTAELAEWDDESLARTLEALKNDESIDELVTGFSAEEIEELLGRTDTSEIEEDEVPEVPDDPVTKPGDLIVLGEHRLFCGDSTHAHNVNVLLAGEKPFLMVTDPPYGVEYDPNWRAEAAEKGQIRWGIRRDGKVENDERCDWSEALSLFPGEVAYVWHGGRFAGEVAKSLCDLDFQIRTQIIWRKQHFAISRGHYHWQHEPCWYAVKKGATAKWCGDRTQSTIWEITAEICHQAGKSDQNTKHGTQKPLECMARPIRNHGDKDDLVYDPFLGSGTTIIAAEKLGRKCYGLELSPAYCDVIVKRWENLTGKQSERMRATHA